MKRWLLIVLIALAGVSCKMVRELSDTGAVLAHGEVIARVGKHRLHRSELEKFIPSGVSPEDSTGLAQRYIKAWAEELIMLDMAEKQLSVKEKDLTEELEQYRRSLLTYRYQQKYINQRLDTLVTDDEIEAYYKANPDKFKLDRPVIKSRYLVIPADSRAGHSDGLSGAPEDRTVLTPNRKIPWQTDTHLHFTQCSISCQQDFHLFVIFISFF